MNFSANTLFRIVMVYKYCISFCNSQCIAKLCMIMLVVKINWKRNYFQRNMSVESYIDHFVKTHYRGVFSRAAKSKGVNISHSTDHCMILSSIKVVKKPTDFKVLQISWKIPYQYQYSLWSRKWEVHNATHRVIIY